MPYACPINGKGAQLSFSTPSSAATSRSPTPATGTPQLTVSLPGPELHGTTGIAPPRVIDQDHIDFTPTRPPQRFQHPAVPSLVTPTPIKSPQKFYIYNDEDMAPPRSPSSSPIKRPLSQPQQNAPLLRSNSRKNKVIGGGISKLSLNLTEIIKFPKESTHAYSYAHLSPNSLAVRLSILKRSLEILIDRPDLINGSDGTGHGGFHNSSPLNLDIESFITQMQTEKVSDETPASPTTSSKINIRSNASSAALAALFNSSLTQPPSRPESPLPGSAPMSPHISTANMDQNASLGLKALIDLLQEDKLSDHKTSRQTLARNLHDLSLSTAVNKDIDPESQLKTRLLYALATPFYEPIVQTPIISLNKGASTFALSSLAEQSVMSPPPPPSTSTTTSGNNNSRIFHNVSQKNISPQAVFTCELTDPWNLKAANDLACLIFGVSRNSLRRLTLLDLISPDSRDFVLNKLISNSITNTEIIFSGEIIAIAKSGNKLTWASLWAKKKGNLIICMFDQVPCDSVDLIVNMNTSNIESHKTVSGNNFFNQLATIKNVDELVTNFAIILDEKRDDNSTVPRTILDSQILNDQRYFTVKKSGYKIPCAITSKVIDEDEGRVKIKIHTMPYIAGVFIISSVDYKVLSFNQSISKNLFGLGEKLLLNQSIDTIVPNFSKIMKFVSKNVQNLKIVPGLVLPEHFFRQMDAAVEGKGEQGFLRSIGINGRHCDGSTLKIDVQLRCSNVDTLVLWITHSRSVYGAKLNPRVGFKEGTKIADGESESYPPTTPLHEQFGDGHDSDAEKELPSQLSILNENEIQSVSRSSSMRSTARSSTNVTSSSTLSSSKPSAIDIRIPASPPDSEASTDVNDYKVLDGNLDEYQLLRLENEAIERSKSISSHYPKKIGLKRREKSINEFEVIKKMGQGAYGRVVLAENKKDPLYRVVIKLIIKERILVDTWVRDRKLGTIPSEIQIMATLNSNPHPNIMRLIDFFEDEDYYYIETPPHGFPSPAIDLFDLIELKKDMSEFECKSIIKQSVSAINHLHNNGVVHRDLKDENLIIDSNGVIKLIDFGSAAYIKQGPFDVFVGTLDYAAPEVLNGQSYEGKPQDVWSLGILLYTLVYKENPFYNVDEIMEGELRIPFVTCEGCIQLIKNILQRDIRKRPSMHEIVEDEWLNS